MLDANWIHYLERLEALLLARKQLQVSLELKKLLASNPPREAMAPLAAIARRAGHPYLALRILQSLFRQEGRVLTVKPTDKEVFVYGSALIVLGAKTEGLKLFQTIDPKNQPDILLFQANSYISEWRYQEAKIVLEEYLSRQGLKPLQRLVGNLNLCSCYIVIGRAQKFLKLLRESYQLAEVARATHLKLSVIELEAQFYFYQNEFTRAQQIIKTYFPQGHKAPATIFEALLRKWDLLSLAYLSQNKEERLQIIHAVSDLADYCHQHQFWEVYRDCDFHFGLLSESRTNICRAYFGTPYKEYRKNLLQQTKGKFNLPKMWKSSDSNSELSLNRTTAKMGKQVIIEPYKRSWNLFFLLSQDLYRPISLGQLFNDLFPGEYFVKSLAAHRLQQLIGDLRSLFLTQNIQAEIQVNKNSYRLLLRQPVEYRDSDTLFRSHVSYLIHILRQQKDHGYLTAKQIQIEHHISRTMALEVLGKMEEEKLIKKIPKGRETIYQFVKSGKRNL